jgi:hypothetical protein
MKSYWMAATALLLLPAGVSARTWHILNNGSGDAPTIQAGINAAAAGDTVVVGPGTYVENLSIVGKDLVLKSEQGPEVTTLDGSSQPETALYLSGQSPAAVVDGFTITGGRGRQAGSIVLGGAILLETSSASIHNNHFSHNGIPAITRYGGAIMVHLNSSPLISENTFIENTADLGGGISVSSGTPVIRGNSFQANTCRLDGGGIYAVFNSGFVTIEDNEFVENTAGDHGGGIHIGGSSSSQVRIAWNLFARNRADGSAHDYIAGGAIRVASVSGTIVNNTIVSNVGPSWTLCAGGGLSLQSAPATLEVSANIFAYNSSCAITCRYGTQNTLGPNLFWQNSGGNLGGSPAACPASWASNQVFADPLFCGMVTDDYTVASTSPALTGPVQMGFSTTPGCGQSGVDVHGTTWGSLKARYP